MQDPGQAPAGDAETAFAAGNIGVVYGDDFETAGNRQGRFDHITLTSLCRNVAEDPGRQSYNREPRAAACQRWHSWLQSYNREPRHANWQ